MEAKNMWISLLVVVSLMIVNVSLEETNADSTPPRICYGCTYTQDAATYTKPTSTEELDDEERANVTFQTVQHPDPMPNYEHCEKVADSTPRATCNLQESCMFASVKSDSIVWFYRGCLPVVNESLTVETLCNKIGSSTQCDDSAVRGEIQVTYCDTELCLGEEDEDEDDCFFTVFSLCVTLMYLIIAICVLVLLIALIVVGCVCLKRKYTKRSEKKTYRTVNKGDA